ncbi:MAG: recombinase family protein, partial [Clostridiales bacterium]|nr:recombinase family protein [Clostridiales bacterium]
MKTAVIYARYSSDSQTEQSIEGQLRVCKDFAERNNIAIINTYIDRAMTGTNDNRPDFQRMIKDSNKRLWDYVIVYKLDRFSRNKYEATIHKHTLSNNGVKLLSAMENIPDTPEGIILESLLEGMNQYYSAELSQKVHRG